MATQFKHIDFPAAQAPSRAPNAALAAVTHAFGSMPEQTLEQVAEQPQQLDLAAWDAALGKAEAAIAAREAYYAAHIAPALEERERLEEQKQIAGAAGERLPADRTIAIDWGAHSRLCKDATRAAEELATLTPPNPNGLILVLRLLCDTAAIDAADAVRDAIKHHAGDLLDGAVVRDRFMGGALAHWQRLWSAVEETRAECRRYEAEVYNPVLVRYIQANARLHAGEPAEVVQAEIDAFAAVEAQDSYLAGGYCDARDQLYRAPAPGPAELAVKLQLMADEQDWARCDERTAEILASDARRFGRLGAFLQRDADLLSAFAELRSDAEHWFTYGPDMEHPWNTAADARRAEAEDLILTSRATTIEGVLAKLRVAFPGIVEEAWSDHAVADPTHLDFIGGLRSGDWYPRLMWGAIDDLAKLGGVDLASMGADGRETVAAQATPPAVEPRETGPAQPDVDDAADLHSILQKRNSALSGLDKADLSDDEGKAICRHMYELEERLFDTPSATSNDVMTKLLLIAQIVEEGFECNQELAAKVLAEARGLGLAEPARPWVAAA